MSQFSAKAEALWVVFFVAVWFREPESGSPQGLTLSWLKSSNTLHFCQVSHLHSLLLGLSHLVCSSLLNTILVQKTNQRLVVSMQRSAPACREMNSNSYYWAWLFSKGAMSGLRPPSPKPTSRRVRRKPSEQAEDWCAEPEMCSSWPPGPREVGDRLVDRARGRKST